MITVKLWGLEIASTQLNLVLSHLEATTRKGQGRGQRPLLVGTPNPEQLVLSRTDSSFRENIGKLDILLPDGVGLVSASRVLSWRWGTVPLLERVTGVDVTAGLLESSNKKPEFAVLVVGGRELGTQETSQKSGREKEKEVRQLTTLTINGRELNSPNWYWVEGYQDVRNKTEAEEIAINRVIQQYKPKVVFVALGAPFQEAWLVEHAKLMQASGARVAIAVGGTFDMLSGRLPRAPRWMRSVGLEWAYRLYQEPWRWRRQAALLTFAWMTFLALFKRPNT